MNESCPERLPLGIEGCASGGDDDLFDENWWMEKRMPGKLRCEIADVHTVLWRMNASISEI